MSEQQIRPTARPTGEISDVILSSMDRMFEQLMRRLDGLIDEEYLWEPVAGMWSVRSVDGGATTVVDGAGVREIEPAPVPTIAWRLWHIAMDCLDDYTRRFAGDHGDAPPEWTRSADLAVLTLQQKWAAYRSVLVGRDWWEPLGADWEHWSQHCTADMAMHAGNELIHHAAEIALLRDLYRASFRSQPGHGDQ